MFIIKGILHIPSDSGSTIPVCDIPVSNNNKIHRAKLKEYICTPPPGDLFCVFMVNATLLKPNR